MRLGGVPGLDWRRTGWSGGAAGAAGRLGSSDDEGICGAVSRNCRGGPVPLPARRGKRGGGRDREERHENNRLRLTPYL